MTHQPSSEPAQEADEQIKELRKEADSWDGPHTHTGPSLTAILRKAADTIETLRRQVAELRDNGTRLLQAADGWKLSTKYFQEETNGYERATERVIKERDRLGRLLAEWEHNIKHWGTIEVMIRNPSVADTVKHWEDRAEKAEAENAALRGLLKLVRAKWMELYGEIVAEKNK